MNTQRNSLLTVLLPPISAMFTLLPLVAAATIGCGNDPLVGTWQAMQPAADPLLGGPRTITMNLNADYSGRMRVVDVIPASSPIRPGCTETQDTSGWMWSDSASGNTMILLMSFDAQATQTGAYTGCANPSDNQSGQSTPIAPGVTRSMYVFMNGNLILGGARIVFMRQ
jgi:hypothetical protein